jgi:hypothetical protein
MRFVSYGIKIKNKQVLKYLEKIQNDNDVADWVREAKKEKPYFVEF